MGQTISLHNLVEQELNRQEMELPIIDHMASSLGQLLRDENASVQDISQVIEKDPTLTAKVLNLSNSVFYSGVVKVKSVDRAIVRVGMKPIRSFLTTVSMKNIFRDEASLFTESLKANWRHSLACALGARAIAEHVKKRAIAEDAYLIGLLHDIGSISIFNALNTISKNTEKRKLLDVQTTNDIVLSMHSPVGAKLLTKLNFDARFCAIVQYHHAYDDFVRKNDELFNILHLSNAMVQRMGISIFPDEKIDLTELPSCKVLGLDFVALVQIEEKIREGLDQLDVML